MFWITFKVPPPQTQTAAIQNINHSKHILKTCTFAALLKDHHDLLWKGVPEAWHKETKAINCIKKYNKITPLLKAKDKWKLILNETAME